MPRIDRLRDDLSARHQAKAYIGDRIFRQFAKVNYLDKDQASWVLRRLDEHSYLASSNGTCAHCGTENWELKRYGFFPCRFSAWATDSIGTLRAMELEYVPPEGAEETTGLIQVYYGR